jgi:hypothetical protein
MNKQPLFDLDDGQNSPVWNWMGRYCFV